MSLLDRDNVQLFAVGWLHLSTVRVVAPSQVHCSALAVGCRLGSSAGCGASPA